MLADVTHRPDRYRAVTRATMDRLPQWDRLDPDLREAVAVVSTVFPFRTNRYITDRLIDWDRVPDDPMFQLTFPQAGMLDAEDYRTLARLLSVDAPPEYMERAIARIHRKLNPQPAGQRSHNVPTLEGRPLPGLQHKYRETVLLFPRRGQTCHAFCSYCFRWDQFAGSPDRRFAAAGPDDLVSYLSKHPDVTDVLVTGGDPMAMRTPVLTRYLEPLLEIEQVISIRIGTKSVATWPQRFTRGDDADAALRLFERVARAGKQLALMAHYSHPVELSTGEARAAVTRIRGAGANIRVQSPMARHVNDDPATWARLWRESAALGCIPYYMFVVRDTGSRDYFEIPLVRCWEVFRDAYARVSGLGRTARGPVMSAFPGKVRVAGTTEVEGRRAFALEYLQARRTDLVGRPFYARFDPEATWFDDLEPLRGSDARFFEGGTGRPGAPAGDRRRVSPALRPARGRRRDGTTMPPGASRRTPAGCPGGGESR